MELQDLKPRKVLNKAFLKVKPNRTEIESFKSNLIKLLGKIDEIEREENQKNHLRDFLRDTYYKENHEINTKDTKDLVIHHGKTNKTDVGVIIEAKRPSNKSEMIKTDEINKRAFHELILYYLRERITEKNINVKHLIISNVYEWFIFDENIFERIFAQNKKLVKQFQDFEASSKTTDVFYKEIAEPFFSEIEHKIEFAYFDIREYEKPLRNDDKKDDNKLIALFKLLSPEHLLKLPFTNDSNSLDKRFYGELLHIIGLTETKDGSKKIIERNKEGERNTGSFLENAIIQLDSLDKISRLENPSQFGTSLQERLFNVGLELSITWINRILFLKLLEAQLVTYHKGDKSFEFLSTEKIKDYDDLNSLFFQVLARKQNERNEDVRTAFSKVPYLNSSLFEPTEIEHSTLFISQLRNDKAIPLYSQTVLKNDKGKKRSGDINPLEYLFAFLSAYDFTSEGSEEIQEDNKTLINASVLGLIFEKINGYKDGSFFTPGFITMYMCRETIRKSVIQKFNETKDWKCTDINSLYDKIEDRDEANEIVNDIKICDPAVGSGHFLVSALNEMIAIKSDLKILQDREGRRLKEYHFEVVNDEMIVTDEDGELFEYNPTNKESQRIQETLFHEKQAIIENCLFGVDINPNSVKICRLRLWIELLKNAYYKNETELETLPNIDINIKCGNSLVSRFTLDADLKQALKKSASKWTMDGYRVAVDTYRNAQSKEQKREMERLINEIKTNFRSEISQNDPRVKRLTKLKRELFTMTEHPKLFELSSKEKSAWNKKVSELTDESTKIESKIEEIKNNKVFQNAFEWRFEFPEVLDDNGDYVGFDVVIGNPPYVQIQKMDFDFDIIKTKYQTFEQMGDIYTLFYEKGLEILSKNGVLSFITSNKWLRANYGQSLRQFFCSHTSCLQLIDFNYFQVFSEASVDTNILTYTHGTTEEIENATLVQQDFELEYINGYIKQNKIKISRLSSSYWSIIPQEKTDLKEKLKIHSKELKDWDISINYGIKTGLNDAFIINKEIRHKIISKDPKSEDLIFPYLRGRDTRRYGIQHEDLYLIATLPSLEINIEDYQGIKDYLEQFLPKLNQTGDTFINSEGKKEKTRKKTSGKWFETQDSIAYWQDFKKEKLVYAETMRIHKNDLSNFPRFGFDDESFFCDKTTFIATGDNIRYLLGILNSKIGRYLIKEYVTKLDTGGYMMQKVFVEVIPIKIPSTKEKANIEYIVKKVIDAKKKNLLADTTDLESQIDQLVYQLYGLTEEEIEIIENE